MAVLTTLALLLGVAYAWQLRLHGAWVADRLWQVRWPLLFLLGLAVWQSLQQVPLPGAWLAALSPEAWRVHTAAQSAYTLSLDPLQTQVHAALTLAYALMFVMVVLAVSSQERLSRFAIALVSLGVFQALLAIALYSVEAEYSLLFFDVLHDRTKGSFGYHNHFAGYMELCLSVGVGLMLARMVANPERVRGWQGRAQATLAFLLSPNMLLRLMLVVMVIALVLTRSRMGNAAFFTALLLTGLLALWVFKRARTKLLVLVLSLVVVDLVVIGSWVGLERVVERVQGTELLIEHGGTQESVEQRQLAALHATHMVQDFAVFGTGAGSFASTFGRYQAPGDLFFDHAHNDYVQWVAEHGLGGALLVLGFVLSTLVACAKVLKYRKSTPTRGVALGASMAFVCLAIHSSVDFNLQLPANALTLVCIFAMAWAAKIAPSDRR